MRNYGSVISLKSCLNYRIGYHCTYLLESREIKQKHVSHFQIFYGSHAGTYWTFIQASWSFDGTYPGQTWSAISRSSEIVPLLPQQGGEWKVPWSSIYFQKANSIMKVSIHKDLIVVSGFSWGKMAISITLVNLPAVLIPKQDQLLNKRAVLSFWQSPIAVLMVICFYNSYCPVAV